MSSATAPAAANQQPAIGALDGRSADARAELAAAVLGFFVITFDAVVPAPRCYPTRDRPARHGQITSGHQHHGVVGIRSPSPVAALASCQYSPRQGLPRSGARWLVEPSSDEAMVLTF